MSRMRRIRRKKPRAGGIWKKLLLWGVLGALVLAVAAVAGSYLYVRSYLKSDDFLTMLGQSAVDDMNVDAARIAPLDWDGSGIRCDGVTMEGHEFLTSLQAKNIETEFSRWDLLKRAFVITSVNIAELKLQLAPAPFRFREKEEGPRSWVEKNILPDTFRLEKGSIDSLSVSYGVPGRLYALNGTRVESTHDAGSSQYKFDVQGGRLLLPFKGCPEFSLMSGTAQFNHSSRRVNVPSCRLTTDAGGYVDIKGDWDGLSSSWTANMVVNSVPASSILENDWKKHVQGSVSGGVDLRGGRDGLKNIELWIAAAGQVFLSLSVGTGLILTYASYVRKKEDIALSGLSAAASNEVCEVGIAGMMTVPAAVAFLGVAGAAGQGTFALGFMVLPQAFAKMGSSVIFGSLFFLLLTVAAVTSSISMMQVGLSFIEEFMGLKRKMAVVVQGFFTATGTLIVAWYSGNLLAMDTYDFFLGTLCFFVSAMVMMILFSWKLGVDRGLMDLEDGSVIRIPRIYRFIMKFVTPTLLLAIFLTWLAQNIWVKQAAPIEALGRGEHGAVIPMGFLAAYTLFLLFITMASGRHKVYHGPR